MKTHTGDLIIKKENKVDYSDLVEVSGSVYVQEGATFTAPALAKSGSVYVQEGATFTAPALKEVSGSVDVQEGATFTAPALKEVSGYVDVRQGATFTAPALADYFYKIGYKNLFTYHTFGKFPEGIYVNITEGELDLVTKIKPLLPRINMGEWHQNNDWKKHDIKTEINECNTTHCLAGWAQVFGGEKYKNMVSEEAGNILMPNLKNFFFSDKVTVEKVFNTLIP